MGSVWLGAGESFRLCSVPQLSTRILFSLMVGDAEALDEQVPPLRRADPEVGDFFG
jgi:hypothetical protein